MSTYAPIVLFTFNRSSHTQRTVEALQRNEGASDSELFVFCDGPRNQDDRASVNEVREYIHGIRGFKNITVKERGSNIGLAHSVIQGVTEVVEKFGRVIVLEDDLVCAPHFLSFMNRGLSVYADEGRVAAIHGYVPPIVRPGPDAFLLRFVDCWGWATWSRCWQLFEEDGSKLLEELRARNLERKFNFNGTYDYIGMLEKQISGANDSWAVRWYASAFLKGLLGVFPGQSLIQHIGWDGGTHFGDSVNSMYSPLIDGPIPVGLGEIREDEDARRQMEVFYRSLKPSVLWRLRRRCAAAMKAIYTSVFGSGES